MKSLVLALCVWTCAAHAAKIEDIDFADDMTVGSTKLVLNGGGMRKKKKFFKLWDVYVGALYLPAKSSDAAAIMASTTPKVLEMVYVRSVSKKDIQKGWKESFDAVCGADCEAANTHMTAFNDAMVDVEDKSRMKVTIDKDTVTVTAKGPKEEKTATVTSDAFRRVVLNMFLGEKTTAPELKPKLLGQ